MSWPWRLGFVCPPEDNCWSYKDYRRDIVWRALFKIARRRGVKVYVIDFGPYSRDYYMGLWVRKGSCEVILINRLVPNLYKPKVLAHELAHHQLHRDTPSLRPNYGQNNFAASAAYELHKEAIEQEADRFADRLLKFTVRHLPPLGPNDPAQVRK